MPWVEKKPKEHNCVLDKDYLPNPRLTYESGVAIGSIYECDKTGCGRRYILQDSQRDGLFWSEVRHPGD